MAKKKTLVRKPIEKLSEKEAVVLIEDSSSEEETEEIVKPEPPKAKAKKPRTPAQIAATERLKEANRKRREEKAKAKKNVVIEEPAPALPKPALTRAPTPQEIDEDDKPLTMKQMKAFMASQQPDESKPKTKRKYVKKEKKPEPIPPPTSSHSVAQMLFV